MQNGALFIGIDAGTTNIKASLYREDLTEVAAVSSDIKVYNSSKGASEIDMIELWDKLCLILRTLKEKCGENWRNITGVGISGQGDGLWAIAADGEPVRRHAILWNDTRSKDLGIESINGLENLLRKECCNNVYTGSAPALQKWLKINEPENYKKICVSLHCKDWLNYKLTGVVSSDYSDVACSSGMNIKTLSYVPEVFDLLDISESLATMPKAVDPVAVIGTITYEAMEATGLPEGVKVIAGCIDCCSVSAGTGFFEPGSACTIIGTALINEVCIGFDEIDPNDLRGLLLFHVVKGRYIKMMAAANGTSGVDYMKGLICPDEDFKTLDENVEKLPIGSGGLLFLPYLFGERAPFKNPYAFGTMFGIRNYHTRHEHMRAVYEGLAMSFVDSYQGRTGINTMYLSGGASKSKVICQMFCDVIGLPVKRQTNSELGALGIAKMLLVALGFAKNFESLRTDSFIEYMPDMARHKKYKQLYERFISYRDSIQRHWISENHFAGQAN
jgi:sugar (pentulose or hexulose) kinase